MDEPVHRPRGRGLLAQHRDGRARRHRVLRPFDHQGAPLPRRGWNARVPGQAAERARLRRRGPAADGAHGRRRDRALRRRRLGGDPPVLGGRPDEDDQGVRLRRAGDADVHAAARRSRRGRADVRSPARGGQGQVVRVRAQPQLLHDRVGADRGAGGDARAAPPQRRRGDEPGAVLGSHHHAGARGSTGRSRTTSATSASGSRSRARRTSTSRATASCPICPTPRPTPG